MILADPTTNGSSNAVGTLFTFVLLFAVYCVPLIIACIRHHQVAPVAVVNILLGWTILGWIAALVMAISDKQKHQQVVVQQYTPPPGYGYPPPPTQPPPPPPPGFGEDGQ